MSRQSALYSEEHASGANLTLVKLGIDSWGAADVEGLQKKIKAKSVDGWFGPNSVGAYKLWVRKNWPRFEGGPKNMAGHAILGFMNITPPEGLKIVNHRQSYGVPALLDDTGARQEDPTQMLIHRGAQTHRKDETYAQSTERVLDSKGCSTTFTMGPNGVIYQHFDPQDRYGIHCRYHNRQSDSIDIAGPFDQTKKPETGQEKITLKMAIGRNNDRKPPLTRKYGTVKCWAMTPAQRTAFALFLPWWCNLRGIPLTACKDWRTFRLSGKHGTKDPVTDVVGILAHTQVANPGSRVDGILPLHHLLEDGCPGIEWRSAEDFFEDD